MLYTVIENENPTTSEISSYCFFKNLVTKHRLGILFCVDDYCCKVPKNWARILVQVTIYRRLLIGRDVHLDQSEACDIS